VARDGCGLQGRGLQAGSPDSLQLFLKPVFESFRTALRTAEKFDRVENGGRDGDPSLTL
jgi:hypothetical protein